MLLGALSKMAASPGSNDVTFGPTQKEIASMRTKDGGFAFAGLQRTTSFAYLGSWFLCLKHVASKLGAHSWATFSAKCPSVADQMHKASAKAVEHGAVSRPVDWLTPLEACMPKMQSRLADGAAKAQRDKLLASLSDWDVADVRSHGGPGAGAFLLPPPPDSSAKPLPDMHFRVNVRDRLLLSLCPDGSTCKHRRADGTLCGAPLDRRGKHAIKCKCQGLVDARHNSLRDWSADSWQTCVGLPTTKEQHVPQWDIVNSAGRTVEARLDVATADPSTGDPLFFDVCVWTPACSDASTLRARALHDGKTAADAAADKRRRYSRAGPSLVPLAMEAGGSPGEDMVNFVRRCGAAWAATHDDDLSAYSRLWHECSSLLQRANAELVLSALGA